MRILTPFIHLIAFTALAAVAVVVWLGISFRQFETIEAAGDLNCTPVIGVHGASDIEVVPDTDAVFLSSHDRRGGALRGQILRFDTANPLDESSWRDRTSGQPAAFEPMGIDLYTTPSATGGVIKRLFAFNLAGPEVLLYDVDRAGDLAFRQRFSTAQWLVSPNDVVATGPASFYVTNDTAAGRDSWRGRLDFLLGLKTGQLLYFDGTSWSVAADGLAFPNGLALSEDGTALYLAEMRAKRIVKYERDPDTDVLTRVATIPLDSFPDNLSLDAEGNLLVGSVPQPLSFTAYGQGLRETAASVILRITPTGEVHTLFQDPGEELSAATVGVEQGGRVLIGSRAADRFLMCGDGA